MALFTFLLYAWLVAQIFYFGQFGPDLLFVKMLKPHRVLFVLMMLSFFVAKARGETVKRSFGWPERLMILLTVASLVSLALTGVGKFGRPVDAWFSDIFNLTLFPYTTYYCVRSFPYQRRWVVQVLTFGCVFSLYLAPTGIFEHFKMDRLVWPDYIMDPKLGTQFGRARGPFMESVNMGRILTFGFASWLILRMEGKLWVRILSYIFIPACLAALYFTETRGPWCGCAIVCMALIYFKTPVRKTLFRLGFVVAIAAVCGLSSKFSLNGDNVFLKRSSTVTDRMVTWIVSSRMMEAHPVFGVGYGHFYYEWSDYFATDGLSFNSFDGSHNTFMTMGAEMGVPTLLAFMAMLYLLGVKCFKTCRRLSPDYTLERTFAVLTLGLLLMYGFTGWFSDLRWCTICNTLTFLALAIVRNMDDDVLQEQDNTEQASVEMSDEESDVTATIA